MPEQIQTKLIEEEMKESYIDYSMSVIVGRALPDVHDGLKPVHRRILYAMNDLGLLSNKPFKKSANVVGSVIAKFHPHGDAAVYDSMVRMAQGFSLRYPLIEGHGNWGSQDGDSAAAYRYCITGNNLIFTNGNGVQEIKNLSNKEEDNINIKVISYNSSISKASKFFNSGKHKTIKIVTKTGYNLEGSFNHPIIVWTINKNYRPLVKWKLLKDLKQNDIAIINRNRGLFSKTSLNLRRYIPKDGFKKNIKLPTRMNNELAFLLGALVSEGSFHRSTGGLQILFNNKDMTFYNKIKDILLSQCKGIKLYERRIKGGCIELAIYHTKVIEFLKNIGLTEVRSREKEIPFSVLMSTKNNIKNFLIALFEGDGSIAVQNGKNPRDITLHLTYNSNSLKLLNQLKILLLNFCVVSNKPYLDKRYNCYKMYISSHDNMFKFYKNIGFFSNRKKNLLKQIENYNKFRFSRNDFIPYLSRYIRQKYKNYILSEFNFDRYNLLRKNYDKLINLLDINDKLLINWILRNNYYFDKVKTIKTNNREKEVYSIRVDSSCHSFVANGFINHNTEARLSKMGEELLDDIDKETVKFVPNFDNSTKEPVVLPSKFPNLLVNGSSGIAVGMATNMPPHNISEAIEAIIKQIENPEITIEELIQYIKGPDFPTGGIILGRTGILNAYKTGRGQIRLRANVEIKEKKLIVTEIPYQVNKSLLIGGIVDLVRDKRVEGISDIRDESDRKGMRIVIELKQNANPEVVLNQLYKHSQLQTTFGVINLALVAGQPKILDLKFLINSYIKHRKRIVIRKTQFELAKAQDKGHILEGLKIALNNIDPVVKTIKNSDDVESARMSLIKNFKLTEKQAVAILDMRLQRLTSLETSKVKKEHEELIKQIAELKSILADEKKIYNIIKQELLELKEKYGDPRRTQIIDYSDEDIIEEDLIKEEQVVITMTHQGYVKRLPIDTYKQQKRGGKGIIATETKEEDFVEHLFITSTHNYILFFTDKGNVFWLKGYRIPDASRYSKGSNIINLLNIEKDEKITSMIPIKEFNDNEYLLMVTKKGVLKKTALNEYSNPRKTGIIAMNLRQNDKLVNVKLTNSEQKYIIATRNGIAIRFDEKDVRSVGRNATGVRGIKLTTSDEVIGMELATNDQDTLLTVTEKGYGKRSLIEDYRLIRRGGKGVINIKTSDNGKVVAIKTVKDDHELMLITKKGILIRISVKDIRVIGRNTQGVRIMKLKPNDKLVNVARVINNGN